MHPDPNTVTFTDSFGTLILALMFGGMCFWFQTVVNVFTCLYKWLFAKKPETPKPPVQLPPGRFAVLLCVPSLGEDAQRDEDGKETAPATGGRLEVKLELLEHLPDGSVRQMSSSQEISGYSPGTFVRLYTWSREGDSSNAAV